MHEDTIDVMIWRNIKAEIEHSEKTKTQIAEEIKVSKPTISQYLSGKFSLLFPLLHGFVCV